MFNVSRATHEDFINWVTCGKPEPLLNILRSEYTERNHPNIHWSKLQFLIINWSDYQCNKILGSGSNEFFADLGQLYELFVQHWNKYRLDFFEIYPQARGWDKDQINYLPLCLFELLIKDLTGFNDRTKAKMVQPYDRQRIRSNAYELAHYLLNLRQRMDENTPIIDQPRLTHMLKVHSKERTRPKRNILFHDAIYNYLLSIRYRDLASEDWEIIQRPQGRDWLLDVWGDFLKRINIKEIAPFQFNCFKTLLDNALLAGNNPEPFMITAGTGFGKTEAFLFPIMFYGTINLLRQRPRSYGPDAILVYPRIDLCNNQLERYLWYAYCLKESIKASLSTVEILSYSRDEMFRVALGHSGVNDEGSKEPFRVKCPICNQKRQEGFIMVRKTGGYGVLTPFCTTDEVGHDVKQLIIPQLKNRPGSFNLAIATTDTLHRRLMDIHGRTTLWKNGEFLPRFIVFDEIHIYEGQTGSHVANLARRLKVYLQNIKLQNNVIQKNQRPPIFVGSSATVGNPHEVGSAIFGASETVMRNRVLKPEEEESEPMGREYIYLLKSPPIRAIQEDTNRNDKSRVVSEQATLLQALMLFWHAMRKTVLQNSGKYRLLTFADSIDTVWRITKNLDDAEGKRQLYKYRIPRALFLGNTDLDNGNNRCPKRISNTVCNAPPHHFFERCEIYQQGECWWNIGSSPDVFLRPMNIVGRISGLTKAPKNFPANQSLDQWDCMIATSTLEVGFDHSELIATAQFKAPPNPASFQQRKGRGGRGIEDIPLTLVVLGNSPGDLFAFKHEQRYFEPTQDDLKIQFDAKNKFIRNQHALSAIFDFMGWSGITKKFEDIHKKCDLRTALEELKQHRDLLNNWMFQLYGVDGLGHGECAKLVEQCLYQIEQSVVTLSYRFPGIYNSLDLFRKNDIPPDWKFFLRSIIEQGNGDELDRKTLIVLNAAEQHKEDYLHPPDYFNSIPIDNNGQPRDPSWVIPKNFIPIPIGGNISIVRSGVNHNKTDNESKLQALSTFLPGGYKNRWEFKLWYGEWLPVPGHEECADISNLERNAEELGTLKENLAGRPAPPSLHDFDPLTTSLVNPRDLTVKLAGENFFLTPDGKRIRNANDGHGGIRLSREPSSVVQTYDLIIDKIDNSAKIGVIGNACSVHQIQFGDKDLLRLFYSNLVNCYPSHQQHTSRSPISINLKFYNREKNRYTIPTVKMRTQGLVMEGSLTQEFIQQRVEQSQKVMTQEEHYWRLVYRLLWRKGFMNQQLNQFHIDFSYDCIRVLKALRYIDYHHRLANHASLESIASSQIGVVFENCRSTCEKLQLDLFDSASIITKIPECWNDLKDQILCQARIEFNLQIAESYVQSLAMAVCRDVAGKTNTNLDLIKTSINVYQLDGDSAYTYYACVYDNIEGGNGTISSYIDRVNSKITLEQICIENSLCDTNSDERKILRLFQDSAFDADKLYYFAKETAKLQKLYSLDKGCHPQEPRKQYFSEQALFKISRLTTTPSITAFYQGVAESYKALYRLLQREPGEEELACYLNERPIADPRGNQLFKKFKIHSGGISELIPQIAELMPLCHGSCPDCLGDSRLSFEKGDIIIPDRFLLGGLV